MQRVGEFYAVGIEITRRSKLGVFGEPEGAARLEPGD